MLRLCAALALLEIGCNRDDVQVCDPPERCEEVQACTGCDYDFDGRAGVDLGDASLVLNCRDVEPESRCSVGRTAADVDCDGDVDFCDVERVLCTYRLGGECCDEVVCGACHFGGGCEQAGEGVCAPRGTYDGDGTACDDQ